MAIPDLSSEKSALPPFRPTFNIFIPVLRLAAVLIGLFVFLIMFLDHTWAPMHLLLKDSNFYWFIICSLMVSIFIFIYLRAFLTKTKNYTITDVFIKQYNFLSLSSTYYAKEDIEGYTTGEIRSRYLQNKLITIYLMNGKRIILRQFSYFNFSDIPYALTERGYEYLGEEEDYDIGMWSGWYYRF